MLFEKKFTSKFLENLRKFPTNIHYGDDFFHITPDIGIAERDASCYVYNV
jgi:hypothetical protein